MKHKTFVSVVVYTRDDTQAVERLIGRMGPWLEERFELYEIVVVDDASGGDVLPAITAAAAQHGVNIAAVQLARRHGVEAGIKAGLDRALGDWIFELETARIDFDLEVLQEMYRCAGQGNDLVTASGDEGSLRSRLFYRFVNHYADLDVPLRTERVRLTSRRALNAMLGMREKVRYRKAMYAVLGAKHHHLTYRHAPTTGLLPQMRVDRENSSLAFDILLSFSSFGLSVAHRLSFAFGAVSVCTVFYAIAVFLVKNDVAQGWTTITVLTSGGFAGLFLVLGILGEYLARILIEVRARPLYSIRDTVVTTPVQRRDSPSEPLPAFLIGELGTQRTSVRSDQDLIRAHRD